MVYYRVSFITEFSNIVFEETFFEIDLKCCRLLWKRDKKTKQNKK